VVEVMGMATVADTAISDVDLRDPANVPTLVFKRLSRVTTLTR